MEYSVFSRPEISTGTCALLAKADSTSPGPRLITSRRRPRAFAVPWSGWRSARGAGAGKTGPAARGRWCSGPGGGQWARRCRGFRCECGVHLARGTSPSVRMLWVRSASLIRMTRTSRAMASSILRKDSAWFSSRVLNSSFSSLVSPSTSSATGAPKRSINSGLVTPQSSIASCSRAAMRACASSFHSAHCCATAIGWVM